MTNTSSPAAPWLSFYGSVPACLDYSDGTMWDGVRKIAEEFPRLIAFDFMGRSTSYGRFRDAVETCARGLYSVGVRAGDRVTICLPNCPQGVIVFYAVNALGGVSNMVHPLSGEKEIEFYLQEADSRVVVTLDLFYEKFQAVRKNVSLDTLIVTSVADVLPLPLRVGYRLTEGRRAPKIERCHTPEAEVCNIPEPEARMRSEAEGCNIPEPEGSNIPEAGSSVLFWKDLLGKGRTADSSVFLRGNGDDEAVILYSGGTTGKTKGVLLTNRSFNALAQQVIAANPMFRRGDKMLAVMPMFHGFGLGISIHSMLFHGGRCLLVPRFTAKSYARLLKTKRCNFIAGVPSLYEALLREPTVKNADLSCLKGVFSGGDSLSVSLKKRLDAFLSDHNAPVSVREGYGTTECVTASCLTPYHMGKEGSIGIPFPDTYYKIVRPESEEEVPYGEEGEICLAGPTVMRGYLNNLQETKKVLRQHSDGLTWVHTGDLGTMDEDGFIYFRQRMKRVIVTNGYKVYPSQIENVLDSMEEIRISCVIGVDDPLRMQVVKAYVVLKQGYAPCDEIKDKILERCRKYVAKYALPRQIEFRDSLPKTSVGKVAYRLLEEEEKQRNI